MAKKLTPPQREQLLETLQTRFAKTMPYHPHTQWEFVLATLSKAPEKLETLYAMEASGGEPNVVDDPEHPASTVFIDCAAESPAGRRSLCYDQEALLSRKKFPPTDSADNLAASLGMSLLSEAQYQALQTISDFDLKTSSWIQTPADVRALGGALFCDKRFGRVFTYHNGADSYYAARGFRGYIVL